MNTSIREAIDNARNDAKNKEIERLTNDYKQFVKQITDTSVFESAVGNNLFPHRGNYVAVVKSPATSIEYNSHICKRLEQEFERVEKYVQQGIILRCVYSFSHVGLQAKLSNEKTGKIYSFNENGYDHYWEHL